MGARRKRRRPTRNPSSVARPTAALGPATPSAPAIGFDVRKGHQSPWTGAIGAVFVLGMFAGYAAFGVYGLPGAGPPVPVLFSLLPERFRFTNVDRTFFDLLLIVGLLFQLMATWELLSEPAAKRGRGALGIVAACAMVGVWTCPAFVHDVVGVAFTSMEIGLLATSAAFLAVGYLGWRSRSGAQVRGERAGWDRAFRSGLVRWLSSYALFTAAWLFYVSAPYYASAEDPFFENWRITVTLLWSGFGVFGLPYAIWTARVRTRRAHDFGDPGLLLFLVYKRLAFAVVRGDYSKVPRLRNRRVRVMALDLTVKGFFLPLMVSFLFLEAANFASHMIQVVDLTTGGNASAGVYSDALFKATYGILRDSVYVIDVSIGLLGYACSFWWLGNKSRSVESTFGGWLVALACYPPLSVVTTYLFPFEQTVGSPWAIFQVSAIQNTLLVVSLLCNGIYVWATLAFGLRFSNLTNRGIITRGPYRFVRHPAYTAKLVSWACEAAPLFGSFLQMLLFAGWVGIYFLRALTEERHLKADPCYRAYRAEVKHGFIPGLW